MEISDEWFGRILSLPGIVLTFLLVIVPTATLFWLGFVRYDYLHPIGYVGLQNFKHVLNDPYFWDSLKFTIVYTFGVVGISLTVSLLLATGLSRIGQKRGATTMRTLAILPFAVPLILSGFIWRWLLDPAIGQLNYILMVITPLSHPLNIFGDPNIAVLAVILSDCYVKIPFMVIFLLAAIDSINQDLYDAAKVDGARCINTFQEITLPLARNGILYAVFITGMFSFRTIDAIWSMTRGGPGKATYHIGIYIYDNLISLMHLDWAAVIGIIVFFCLSAFGAIMFYWMAKEI